MKRKAIGEMEVLYVLGIMLISPGFFFCSLEHIEGRWMNQAPPPRLLIQQPRPFFINS